jgi:alpha-acetolactate decarboxylase
MKRAGIVAIALMIALSLLSPACGRPAEPAEPGITPPVGEEEYISIFNRVDELLMGDLSDTVSLGDLRDAYSGKEIIGLGTTLREYNGEIFFMDGSCYWADPVQNGRVVELDWRKDNLPFCAITVVDVGRGLNFEGVEGNIHSWVTLKARELGIKLAAVKIEGIFSDVNLSIARTLPKEAGDELENAYSTIGEKGEWTFVGFYAEGEDEQNILSVAGHPVHLHGKIKDSRFGGHLQWATSVYSNVKIFPLDGYILTNRLPQ